MALLFYDGFDQATNSNRLIEKWDASVTTFTSLIAGRTGINAVVLAGVQTSALTQTLTTSGTTAIIGCAIRFRGLAAASIRDLIRVKEDLTTHMAVSVNSSRQLLVRRDTTTLATSSTSVIPDKWYYLEFKTLIDNAAGSYEVRIDESIFGGLSGGGVDTRNGGAGTWNKLGLLSGSETSVFGTTVADYDDVYVCDGSGAQNNDFLGDSKVYSMFPQTDAVAPGTNADFTPSTGSDHGAMVDETNPNGDTDYNASSTPGNIDTYNFPTIVPTGAIRGVAIDLYMKDTDAGARTVSAATVVNGTTYIHPVAITPNTSYRYRQQIFEQNPDTALDWTETDINDSEFGLSIVT